MWENSALLTIQEREFLAKYKDNACGQVDVMKDEESCQEVEI